jgi:glycosyltransferase involved in cell wall biosynthesis
MMTRSLTLAPALRACICAPGPVTKAAPTTDTPPRDLRVGIDLTARLPVATGVDNYLEQLVLALARVAGDEGSFRFFLFLARGDRRLAAAPLGSRFERSSWCPRTRLVRLPFQQLGLPLLARRLGLDVLHSPSFIQPLWRAGVAHVLTVYDTTIFTLAPLHNALHRSAAYRWAVATSMRRADRITVPSRWVRSEVERLMPELESARVRVTRPGVSADFAPRGEHEIESALARLGVRRPYVLSVGTLEPRKNLRRLVVAFDRLVRAGAPEDLVLAGRLGWGYHDVLDEISARKLSGRVHLLGYVEQAALPALMSGARAFAYPSLHEGFGFPPLEAMACGTPTVAGASSSLVENLDGAAELADPEDPDSIAEALGRLLGDDALWRRRREEGLRRAAEFDWDRTARETLAVYREAARC